MQKYKISFMIFTASFYCAQATKVFALAPRLASLTQLIFKLVSAAVILSGVKFKAANAFPSATP